MAKRLTSQQEHFAALLAALPDESVSQVKAYLLAYDWNGNPENARVPAHALSQKPEVIARVDELRQKHLVKLVTPTLTKWVREAEAVTFYDPTSVFDDEGKIKAVKDWPNDVKRSIAGFDVEKRTEGQGPDKEVYYVIKVRFVNKVQALEVLGRHLGAFVGADGIVPGFINEGVMIFNMPAKRFIEGDWETHYMERMKIAGAGKTKGATKGNGSPGE
jgi:hypothetical protein